MNAAAHDVERVRRFWGLYQARQWSDARALLNPAAQCRWWATRERFDGAAAIVHVNMVYPEGWAIHLLELNPLADGRVHTLVRVDQGGRSFHANSFFTLAEGLIMALDEYWADVQPPPAWRAEGALPGVQGMPVDQRAGVDLTLSLDEAP